MQRIGVRVLVVAATASGLLLTGGAILVTQFRYDDISNSDVRNQLAQNGDTLLDAFVYYVDLWAQTQGRFFPGSVGWTLGMFYVFDTRIEYKVLLVALVALAIAATAAVAWTLSRSRGVTAITALTLVATVQIRNYLDGIVAFSGLLPLTVLITMVALLILLRRATVPWLVLAGLLYFLAVTTYETVLLFAPAMIAVVRLTTGSWRRCVPVAIPGIVMAVIVGVLRLRLASAETGLAYTISLDPLLILETFVKQVLAALPLSQWWLRYPDLPPVQIPLIVLCVLLVGIPVFLAAWAVTRDKTPMSTRGALMSAGLGAWMWASSSALVSVTVRWQQELSFGQGYLPVVYGYFGVALVAGGVWAVVTARLRPRVDRPSRSFDVWSYTGSAFLAILCSLTVATNLALVG